MKTFRMKNNENSIRIYQYRNSHRDHPLMEREFMIQEN